MVFKTKMEIFSSVFQGQFEIEQKLYFYKFLMIESIINVGICFEARMNICDVGKIVE